MKIKKYTKLVNGKRIELTQTEIKELKKDERKRQKKFEKRKPIQDRKQAYPEIGEQLDEIWKIIDELKLAKTPEAKEMLKRIKDVKKNNPKY